MKHSLRKWRRIFAMEWSTTLQYRTDAIIWMFAEAAVPLISLVIWYNVAAGATAGPNQQNILTYYAIVVFIRLATHAWNGIFQAQEILNGEIAKSLIRPMPVIWKYIANNIAEKVVKLFIPLFAFLAIAFTLPDLFTQDIFQLTNIILFVASLLLAAMLQFTTDAVIGFGAFWLEDIFQIRRYKFLFDEFASGVLIPFSFMPLAMVTVLSFLPFRYIVSAPAEILLNQPIATTTFQLLITQMGWVAVLSILAVVMWRAGLKRYAIPGS